jgi:GxxExxY protein
MDLNKISYDIIGAAMKIHTDLGPGLLESVYELPLAHLLRKTGYDVKTQIGIPFVYQEFKFDAGFRMDMLVNDAVVVEIKSVETLLDVHHKQLLTYLKLGDKRLGLLINFNCVSLKDSIVRIVNKF